MTDDELIALEHENWIAYLTGVVSCTSRASVTRSGGLVTILTGLPFDWFNQILVESEKATPEGVLAAVARAREEGDHFVVRLREGIDDRFVRTLARAGLEPEGEETSTPGMVAFPIDHDPIGRRTAPELDVRRVTDASGIDIHRQVVTVSIVVGSLPSVRGVRRRTRLVLPAMAKPPIRTVRVIASRNDTGLGVTSLRQRRRQACTRGLGIGEP